MVFKPAIFANARMSDQAVRWGRYSLQSGRSDSDCARGGAGEMMARDRWQTVDKLTLPGVAGRGSSGY